jgi:hypothetical protein
MSLDYSIAHLMNRLTSWSAFPKYSLERRVDIFLTPFLEGFIGRMLEGEATLVAPEFPLLATLLDNEVPQRDAKKWPAHTVNVDYLLHVRRDGARPSWVFVELKTDGGSYRSKQDLTYWNAIGHEMKELKEHLALVQKASKHKQKYATLRAAFARFEPVANDEIELVYLGPGPKEPPPHIRDARRDDDRRDRVRYVSLAAFAGQHLDALPAEHRELWPHVRDLLRNIDRAPRVRGAP